MDEDINILIFLETIQTEGIRYITENVIEGIRFHYYLSSNGNKRVQICVNGETMTKRTAKEYLRQLGLTDLIDRMFYE